jgi:hypothetical protein
VTKMNEMLRDASSFRQNLCAWGNAMKAQNTEHFSMFTGSKCLSVDEPYYGYTPVMPLCKAYCVAQY